MKIGVVFPYYKPAVVYGGPVRSVSALCEGLMQAGAQVTVLTTNANGAEALTVPLGQRWMWTGSRSIIIRDWAHGWPRLLLLAGVQEGLPGKDQEFRGGLYLRHLDLCHAGRSHCALAAGVPFVVSPRGSL